VYSCHLPLKDSTEPSGRLDHASPGIASTMSRASGAGITSEWWSLGAIPNYKPVLLPHGAGIPESSGPSDTAICMISGGQRMAKALHPGERLSSWRKMTLRIDRVGERVRLSGDLRYEHLHQVKAEMDQCGSRSVLDLEEVDRVDVESVHFLNSCEARGVSVLNASAYIRAWMAQEGERPAH